MRPVTDRKPRISEVRQSEQVSKMQTRLGWLKGAIDTSRIAKEGIETEFWSGIVRPQLLSAREQLSATVGYSEIEPEEFARLQSIAMALAEVASRIETHARRVSEFEAEAEKLSQGLEGLVGPDDTKERNETR